MFLNEFTIAQHLYFCVFEMFYKSKNKIYNFPLNNELQQMFELVKMNNVTYKTWVATISVTVHVYFIVSQKIPVGKSLTSTSMAEAPLIAWKGTDVSDLFSQQSPKLKSYSDWAHSQITAVPCFRGTK